MPPAAPWEYISLLAASLPDCRCCCCCQVSKAKVWVEQAPWKRVEVGGIPHDHGEDTARLSYLAAAAAAAAGHHDNDCSTCLARHAKACSKMRCKGRHQQKVLNFYYFNHNCCY
jgi:hypothetical protein